MFNWIKHIVLRTKSRFRENNLDSALWLLDIVPSIGGFSILKNKTFALFWVLEVSLMVYVYLVGSVMFQIRYAQGIGDFIKCYLNISLVIFTVNNSYWLIKERPLLRIVLSMVKQNDDLARESEALRDKHEKHITVVKKIVFTFYALNALDAFCIYMPNQIDPTNNHYSMIPCVGLEPFTSFPKRHICIALLLCQHVTMVIVVLSYQAIMLFLIAHTTAMYQLLSKDMMMFETTDNLRDTDFVKDKLSVLIIRHATILKAIDRTKALYSMPLGVNFGTNAFCILFFFYIPLYEWIKYSPVLIYCFLVFFLYCYLCQKLSNAAESFETAVYCCGWENFNVNEQKLVYVMLIQAQKPIVLLAADIIPVNLYTFASTLQAMYKFVTVVKF